MKLLNKQRIGIAVWLASALLNSGCSDKSATSRVMADETPTEIGAGMNALNGARSATCLDFKAKVVVTPSRTPGIELLATLDDLATHLGMTAEELNSTVSANRLAQFAQTADIQPRMRYILLKLKRTTKIEDVPAPTLLQGQAQNVGIAKNYQSRYNPFVQSCGDKFVSKIERGDALYGLIPVIINGPEQEAPLRAIVDGSRLDPKTIFAKISSYATLGVQALYIGDKSAPKALALDEFQKWFERLDGSYPDAAMQEIITLETKEYREVKTLPKAAAEQATRVAYIDSYLNLNKQLLKADQCIKQHDLILANPIEFKSPDIARLGLQKEGLAVYREELGFKQNICLQDECVDGLCEVTECNSDAEIDPQLLSVVNQCDASTMPQAQTLDAFIYRYWKNEGGANGKLGAMQSLTEKVGDSVIQKFAASHAVRPASSSNTLVVPMKSVVVDRWKTLASQLGEPLAQAARELSNKARVVDFAKGALYDLSAHGVTDIRAVYNLAPHLGENLPAEDEKVLVKDDSRGFNPTVTTSAQLGLVGGTVMFYFKRESPTTPAGPTVSTLNGGGALMGYFNSRGGLNWSVPTVSETRSVASNLDTFFFGAANGYYYHWNNVYQVKEISAATHQIYVGAGGAAWYGRIYADEVCDGTNCWVDAEGGRITRAQWGGLICQEGYEVGGGGTICQRVTCGINYGALRRYTDVWDYPIPNGTQKKMCTADRSIKVTDVICSSGFQRSGESCVAASCGSTPHGSNYNVGIDGGQQTFRCDLGTGTYLSTSCNSGYRKNGRNCLEVSERPRCPNHRCDN